MITINKTESHILDFSTAIDIDLSVALGEMVVAFGRLEDVFKVAIKRLEKPQRTLEEVVKEFAGPKGTIGKLVEHCEKNFSVLKASCQTALSLNSQRQDFVHATFGIEKGNYVRFRTLTAHTDVKKDIQDIQKLTSDVYALIKQIDQVTGAPLSNNQANIAATVSAKSVT